MLAVDSQRATASFNELFGQSVVVGLTNILGKSGAEAILKNIGLGPFPTDPEGVEAGLVAVFQKAGARAIERQILKVLFDRVSERFLDETGDDFAKQVDEVRRRFGTAGTGGAKS